MDVLFWAALVVMFVIIEIATVQLVSIWLAAGSLVTMISTYLFDLTMVQQLLIFLISYLRYFPEFQHLSVRTL